MRLNRTTTALISGAVLLAASGTANAALSMLIYSGSNSLICLDNFGCDLDPDVGEMLILGQVIGDWTVSSSATSQSNASSNPSQPDLEFTISDAETTSPTTDGLLVIVQENAFGPVLSGNHFQTSTSSSDTSDGTLRVISGSPDITAANQIGVLDVVMDGSGFFETTTDAYTGPDTGPSGFTLQLAAQIFHDGVDSTQLTADVSAVPEPSAWVLMGLGLLGAFGASRRRRT